jgi:hypothetical protein
MFKTMRVSEDAGILAGVLLLALMSFSCTVWHRRPPLTAVEPNTADFVGTWVPDAPTLKEMQSKGGYASTIKTSLVLRNDGTFELSNMPDWWSTATSESHGKFDHYSGNWSISQQDSHFWHLTLVSTEVARVVDLFGQNAPYRMAFRIGDPDNDQWMMFDKQIAVQECLI